VIGTAFSARALAAVAAAVAAAIAAATIAVAPASARAETPCEAAPLVFATFAEDERQLREALILAESIRSFAGSLKDAPVWLYKPESLPVGPAEAERLARLGVAVKKSEAPEAALRFPLSAKVFAAAKAEAEATGEFSILVWMDTDTVVWKEPAVFFLPDGKSFGYRPVMLRNISSSWSGPPDEFWSRLYRALGVRECALFPMKTTVDGAVIRPQFNAGLLVVRPERGILGGWPCAFERLYNDTALVGMCGRDRLKAIFFHQAALAGNVLAAVPKDEMLDLPATVNYAVFKHGSMPAGARAASLDGLVTLRYDVMLRSSGWRAKLPRDSKAIDWLEARSAGAESAKRR
jgi:hypothetical protein